MSTSIIDKFYEDSKYEKMEKPVKKYFTINEVVDGYFDDSKNDGSVMAMNGKLCLRPKYQRDYIHEDDAKWKEGIIQSILHGFPIQNIYFGADELEKHYEVIDGQQRLTTICKFVVDNDFGIHYGEKSEIHFEGLTEEDKMKILSYQIEVDVCKGENDAKVAWFNIINQPNIVLTEQELRNSCYVSTWLEDAKKYFSCPKGNGVSKEFVNDGGEYFYKNFMLKSIEVNRQELLEEAIYWASWEKYADIKSRDAKILAYMDEHKNDEDASHLINYYKSVIDWIYSVFFVTREDREYLKDCWGKADWGRIYHEYKDKNDLKSAEYYWDRVNDMIESNGDLDPIKHLNGIFEWVLRGEKDEEANKFLTLRTFTNGTKNLLYNKIQGKEYPTEIEVLGDGSILLNGWKEYDLEELHAHHIVSWKNGGSSKEENCILLPIELHKFVHSGEVGIDFVRALKEQISKHNGKESKDKVKKYVFAK